MPKPKTGVPGSGLHLNFALYDRDGRNVFYDENDPLKLSADARYFMGGLLAHTRGMSAITNPLINSYKRLVPGYEAPVYESWSTRNRSSLIRVPPMPEVSHTQVELRSPHPAANPYLALTVCLAAGLDGIRGIIRFRRSLLSRSRGLYERGRAAGDFGITALPTTMGEAIAALEEDVFIRRVLGDDFLSDGIWTPKRRNGRNTCPGNGVGSGKIPVSHLKGEGRNGQLDYCIFQTGGCAEDP